MSENKIAICYHRKSRVFKGKPAPTSPERQQGNTNAKAADLGLEPENYCDAEGHRSGRAEENRPDWLKARSRIGDPDVGALIVDTWDRPVRNTKLLLSLVDECEAAGIRFISCGDQIDTRSAAGRFQMTIIAGVGEYESNVASERQATAADYLRREHGRHIGLAPFGTERVRTDKDYVLVASTKAQANGTDFAALKHVYEMRLNNPWSTYSMAIRLNAEGWRFRDRRGALRYWTADDVRRVLYNHWIYGGYITIGRSHRGDFEVIKGSHEALLPALLTEGVAATFARRARGWKVRESTVFPLTGILVCGVCDESLRGEVRTDRYVYRHAYHLNCSFPYRIESMPIESQVRERIGAIKMPARITKASDRAVSNALRAEQSSSKTSSADQVRRSLERLKELYIEGDIERADYDRRRMAYEQQVDQMQTNGLNAASVAAIEITQAVSSAGPAAFRDMVKSLYERIILKTDLTLAFEPRDWCRDWA